MLKDLFLSTEYFGLTNLIIEFLGLIIIDVFIVWITDIIIFNRKKKSKLSIKLRLKLDSLSSLIFVMVLFCCYAVLLYILNGSHTFRWLEFEWGTSNTYLRLSPQILCFATIIWQYFKYDIQLKKMLKR